MTKRAICVFSVALLLIYVLALSYIPSVKAGTITVPDDYPTIQEAIDAAPYVEGAEIHVRAGIYEENISFVFKDRISILGEHWSNTSIDGSF